MKRVYVGGPLTPKRVHDPNLAIDYLMNARQMIRAGIELLKAGMSPYIPALDMLIFLCLADNERIDESKIKEHAIQWLYLCDAMLLVNGWDQSEGAKSEIEIAKSFGIPVFASVDELIQYFKNIEG